MCQRQVQKSHMSVKSNINEINKMESWQHWKVDTLQKNNLFIYRCVIYLENTLSHCLSLSLCVKYVPLKRITKHKYCLCV